MYASLVLVALAASALATPLPNADPLEVDLVVRPGSDRALLAIPEIPRFGDLTPEEMLALLGGDEVEAEEPEVVAPTISVSGKISPPVFDCL